MAEGYIFGALDCNVHQLRLASVPELDGDSNHRWSDSQESKVVGRWRSKELSLGSWNLVKQIRQVLLDLNGAGVSATLTFKGTNGVTQTSVALPTTALPDVSDDTPDVGTDPKLCKSIQLEIEGTEMDIREISIVWRGMRMRGGQL